MKESTTYQYIIEEGKEGVLEGIRRRLLRLGEDKFGKPSAAVRKSLQALDDLDRLERMSKPLLKVHLWEELLDTP